MICKYSLLILPFSLDLSLFSVEYIRRVLRYTVISGLFIFNAYQFASKGPVEKTCELFIFVREKESNDEISHVYVL